MAKAWTCENESKLRAVFSLEPKLAKRMVPCRHWRVGPAVWIFPNKSLSQATGNSAIELGFEPHSTDPPENAQAADSPWQLFSLVTAPLPEKLGHEPVRTLFLCPSTAVAADLTARMLELGQDQIHTGTLPGGVVALWAAQAPLYVVLTALDLPGTKVLTEQSLGIFAPLMFRHPFLQGLAVPHGDWLLLDAPFGHLWAKSEAFQPIDQQWQVRQAEPLAVTPGSWDQPIEVTLRLEKSSLQAGKECLWRISPELISTFLEWVGHAPDDQICQLEWVSIGEGDRNEFLVRPIIQTATIVLPIQTMAYERAHPLEPVFIPIGTRLSPPLRVDRLRQVAGLSPGMIAWLETDENQPGRLVQSRTLAASSFKPLDNCLEHQLAAAPEALEAWQNAVGFSDLEELVAEPIAVAVAKAKPKQESATKSTKQPVEAVEVPPPTVAAPVSAPASKKRKKGSSSAHMERATNPHSTIIASQALEAWLEIPGSLHEPKRLEKIAELAAIFAEAGRPRDAADALLIQLWSNSPLGKAWSNDGIGLIAAHERVALALKAPTLASAIIKNPMRLLESSEVTGEDRVAAGRWVAMEMASHGSDQVPPSGWSGLLEHLEAWMPVRHAWLAWMNWNRLTGDVQSLAQAHDRLLRRLAQGLEVGRDSPPFLSGRFLRERGGRSDAGRLLTVMREEFFNRLPLREVDQTDRITRALAQALFAAGTLRAGEPAEGASLWESGSAALDREGPLGKVLRMAVDERLGQIRANLPVDQTPRAFSPESTKSLTATDRYRLDNLRKMLSFLEPAQSINPVSHYLAGITTTSGSNPLRERTVGIQNAPGEQARALLLAGLNDLETLMAGSGTGQTDEMDLCLQLLQAIQERAGQTTVEIARRSLRLGNLLTRRLLEGSTSSTREKSLQFCLRLLRGALHAAGPWGLRDEVDKWLHAALEPDGESPGLFALLAQTGQGRLVGALLQEMVGRLRAWDMETAGFALTDGLEKVVGLAGPEDQASLKLILGAQLARRGQTERAGTLVEQSADVISKARESRHPLKGQALEQRLELARGLVMYALESEPAKGIEWIGAASDLLPSLLSFSQGAGNSHVAHARVLKVVETLVLSLHTARDIETQSGWCEEEEAALRRVVLSQARAAVE